MLSLSRAPQPLLLFIEQLKQPTLKIRSIKSLSTIALALGDVDTRQYLIPFLANLFHQQNLECQMAILQVIPSLIPYLGHSFYSYLILEIVVDVLCVYDQKDLRDLGFGCLFKVLSRVDIRKAQAMLYNTLTQLQEQKELRIKELVIRMIPTIFIGLQPEYQHKFFELFLFYSNDEKQEVRVIVASQLQQLIRIMPPAPEAEIKILLERFLNDPSEKVRIHLIQCVILLNQLLGEKVIDGYFNQLIADSGQSVKCEIYERIDILSKQFSFELLEPLYKQIEGYAEFPQALKNKVLNKLPILFQTYPKIYTETHLKQLLLPPSGLQLQSSLAQSLCILKDQEHLSLLLQQGDNSFKLKFLPKLPNLSKRAPMLKQLFKHKSFRIRSTILGHIQARINSQGEDLDRLLGLVMEITSDKAAVVRAAASNVASKIIQSLKLDIQKCKQTLISYLRSEVWSTRFSALQIVKNIVSKEYLKLWELIRDMKNDKVMSIKMKVVEIAGKMSELGVKSCSQEVEEIRGEVESMY